MSSEPARITSARDETSESIKSFNVESFAASHGGVTRSTLKPGVRVYSQGESADAMFYIRHGQIQISVLSPQGKEAIIGILDAGDFFGEACLIGERQQGSSATCMTNATLARLERTAVIRAMHDDPQFAEFYLVYTLNRTVQLRNSLASHLFNSSERRLARILLLLSTGGKDGDGDIIVGKIDQEALSRMVGTTRSRINYFMNKFRKLGYIDYSGHGNGAIKVRASLLSVVLHDEPLSVAKVPVMLSFSEQSG